VDEMKRWVVKSHVKDLDSEMGRIMVKMSMATDPKEIHIVETKVSGDSADLTVKGKNRWAGFGIRSCENGPRGRRMEGGHG
jgi:hypothetical protein